MLSVVLTVFGRLQTESGVERGCPGASPSAGRPHRFWGPGMLPSSEAPERVHADDSVDSGRDVYTSKGRLLHGHSDKLLPKLLRLHANTGAWFGRR